MTTGTTGSPRRKRLFISFRREDSGDMAFRLHQRLNDELPKQVFIDEEGIEGGDRWPKRIEHEIHTCDAVFALIGPAWLTVLHAGGGVRIHRDDDWVRYEIGQALGRAHKDDGFWLQPLLVRGASMPGADALPVNLRGLPDIKPQRLRGEPLRDWESDVAALIQGLEERGFVRAPRDPVPGVRPSPVPTPKPRARRLILALAALLAMAPFGYRGLRWVRATNLEVGCNQLLDQVKAAWPSAPEQLRDSVASASADSLPHLDAIIAFRDQLAGSIAALQADYDSLASSEPLDGDRRPKCVPDLLRKVSDAKEVVPLKRVRTRLESVSAGRAACEKAWAAFLTDLNGGLTHYGNMRPHQRLDLMPLAWTDKSRPRAFLVLGTGSAPDFDESRKRWVLIPDLLTCPPAGA